MTKWKIKHFFFIFILLFIQINSKSVSSEESNQSNTKTMSSNLTILPTNRDIFNSLINASSEDNATCDRTCFVEKDLGPRTMHLNIKISIGFLYFIILLTGIFGNMITCLVIIFNACMHTTTNY